MLDTCVSVTPTYDADLFTDKALAEPYAHYRALRDLGPVAAAVWFGPAQAVARDWIAGRLRGAPTAVADELAEAAWRSFRAP